MTFFVISVCLVFGADSLNAQVANYKFSGSLISATAGVGETISGTLTLDRSATPDLFGSFPNGQFAQWRNGNFSVNAVTNTGFAAGTILGGNTHFDVQDIVSVPIVETSIESLFDDGVHQRSLFIDSRSRVVGDGLVNIPDPWNPLADEEQFIYIADFAYETGEFAFGKFTIDTFELVNPNIIVNGIDTDIKDFQYNGQFISQAIAALKAVAKNRGQYVSSVTKLTNTLRQAGLMTASERSAILAIVVHQ